MAPCVPTSQPPEDGALVWTRLGLRCNHGVKPERFRHMHYCKARITEALVHFFDRDYRRIEHALSVLRHAEQIAETRPGVDGEILIAAALLHDVGIKPAEKLHGYNDGPLQEQYGPHEAKRLLSAIGFPEEKTVKVMEIIGNHHSRSRYDYIELVILKEADAIVNKTEESEMRVPT